MKIQDWFRAWTGATARFLVVASTAAAGTFLATISGAAQQVADPGFTSVGRGVPVVGALPSLTLPLGPQAGTPPDPEQMQRMFEEFARYP